MEHYWKNDDKNENLQNKTITQDDINVNKIKYKNIENMICLPSVS